MQCVQFCGCMPWSEVCEGHHCFSIVNIQADFIIGAAHFILLAKVIYAYTKKNVIHFVLELWAYNKS